MPIRFSALLLCALIVLSGHEVLAQTAPTAPTPMVQKEAQKELRIIRMTPQGEDVSSRRQIVFEFNRPVVPVGRMDRTKQEIPVTISPELNCEWRWLNTSALACNLSEKDQLNEATTYEITVNPGITAEDGATIAEAFHETFTTERPDVNYGDFTTWHAPAHPVLRLVLNQAVTKESVEQHVYFTPVNDPSKRTGLIVEPDPRDREQPRVVPVPGEGFFMIFGKSSPKKSDDQQQTVHGVEARRVWLIQPKEDLPQNETVSLKVEPGLVSALGPEKGNKEQEIVKFDTFPELQFLGVKCTTNDQKPIIISPDDGQSAQLCNPLAPISLAFNAPILLSQIKKNIAISPDPTAGTNIDFWGNDGDYSNLGRGHKKTDIFTAYMPTALKAAQTYKVSIKARELGFFAKIWHWILSLFSEQPLTDLEDEFGRKLAKPIVLTFATDHRRPNYEIIHHDAVIESKIDSEVPLYVNNLDKVIFDYRSITAEGIKQNQKMMQDIPKVPDIQFAIPFGIREMLGGNSGAVYGHLRTEPQVNKSGIRENRLFAQVTPYQLHVKLGHYSTLVWVTDLTTGEAVTDAKVTIYKDALSKLSVPKDIVATGISDAKGIAILPGTQAIDPDLSLNPRWGSGDNPDNRTRLFVRVDKGKDMAVMPISSDFIIDTWRASGETIDHYNKQQYGHIVTWGTTAQGVYHAGDTIQYKFYVRDQNDKTLVPAPNASYTLEILDPTEQVVHTVKDITLSEFGSYSGEFKTAKQAAVGWYKFRLTSSFGKKAAEEVDDEGEEEESADSEEGTEGGESAVTQAQPSPTKGKIVWFPMDVLVSDFTPSPFKVTNELNGDLFKAGQEIEVTTAAKLHSGGAYTDASARITAILESKTFVSRHPVASKFSFVGPNEPDEESQEVYQQIQPLDANGEVHHKFTVPKQGTVYGTLVVESAVQDDRGKNIAAQSQATYVGVDRLVGLYAPKWLYNASVPAAIDYIVVDERGVPAKGTAVGIKIERQVTNAARVKGAGNAYITNFTTAWKEVATCQGTSSDAPNTCQFTPDEAGSYRLTAEIKDTKGDAHSSQLNIWVTGRDYVLWNEQNDSYLQIIPEKEEYKVGDTARYLIKNPYPGATALITVERYGIIDHFVQVLEGSTPVFELPVKPDYLPGFYLSVTVISPRVDKPLENGQVDLGKPTFRMGYVKVPVKDPYKEMTVTAKTDQEVYRPRDKVTVQLHAEPKHASAQAEPIELAVAVLDESVFDLILGGKDYFDPYRGFYGLEDLDLRNYSLLTRLVGRQKFEKKGANVGGDGGGDLAMRNIFKFVSYWNPSLQTDAQGNATIEFDVPDNLTGWRILAMAATPTDRMGLGGSSFKVNRPTEVRSVMPNQTTEGDAFKAGFSVMNRTDKPRTLKVSIEASGDIDTAKTPASYTETVTLEPYKRVTVLMPIQAAIVKATRDQTEGQIRFVARAGDDLDTDGMEFILPIEKRRSLETAATYGTTDAVKVDEAIAFPDKIHPDIGSVSVVVSPTVIANIEGAFRYMRNYAYLCWEQILTKGVFAAHFQDLKDYLPTSFTWKAGETLADESLSLAAGFQAPNGGMAYFVAEDRYTDPYLSAYTALAFNWLRHSGHTIPEHVEEKLHVYLLNFLRRDAAPDFYSDGMRSTVRAVALAALAEHGKITRADLDRYKPYLKQMSLFGKTHYALAALNVPGQEALVLEAAKMILAQANQTGGKFIFSEDLDDSYTRILASPLRENCAILDLFTAMGEKPATKELVADVPFKLVRTITQTRKNRDHWENTQENMFCMKALVDYSRVYETVKPAMTVQASMDAQAFGEASFADLRDQPVTFERPIDKGDVGRKAAVEITRQGAGRLYYATRVSYAPLDEAATGTNAGIEIHREYSVERNKQWVLLKNPHELKRGELVRVDIYLSLAAARNFVVVDDPVPGGLEPVNRDLATASGVDADKGEFKAAGGAWWFKFSDWISYNVSRWSFYHQEIRHDSVRFYSDYLPPGNYHLSYTAQAIAEGEFAAMPIHAEEMYDPDVYGKGASERLKVAP
ncbi:MAG: alpha-2-macroglobulin family protein [Alphaproteobacteria bacterium]